MKKFQTGYAAVNINPPLGIAVSGYYVPRYAKGFLDDLTVSALVLSLDDKKIVLLSADICEMVDPITQMICDRIAEKTEFDRDSIFFSNTHTHTGPHLVKPDYFDADTEQINKYFDFFLDRIADAVTLAMNDLRPTKMGYITGYAPDRVAYIRLYKMKDGSTQTCPPVNDPNIDHPIGTLDQRVHVVRFDREGTDSLVLVNYGLHADTVNGEMLSSDWPGWMRRTLEKALDGTKCIFFNGAEGDVGSTNVHPTGGDMNDTEISFDNEMKSPGMARFIGRAIAGTVLQVYDKVHYVDVDTIDIIKKPVALPLNVPAPDQIPLAHEYKKYHDMGRDDLIPYTGMELTTVVAEAYRICSLENGPAESHVNITGVRFGDVAMIGIPGEPFTEIGVRIKESDALPLIMPCALVNGYAGYFPTKAAYDAGGYEARSSNYKSTVGDALVDAAHELIHELASEK